MKVLHPAKGHWGWWVPGTLLMLTLEWSWKDIWITPHIGLTTYGSYHTLRLGWLAGGIGICWPRRKRTKYSKHRLCPGGCGKRETERELCFDCYVRTNTLG